MHRVVVANTPYLAESLIFPHVLLHHKLLAPHSSSHRALIYRMCRYGVLDILPYRPRRFDQYQIYYGAPDLA